MPALPTFERDGPSAGTQRARDMTYLSSVVDRAHIVIRPEDTRKNEDDRAADGKSETMTLAPVAGNVETVSSGSVVIVSGTLALNKASAQALTSIGARI